MTDVDSDTDAIISAGGQVERVAKWKEWTMSWVPDAEERPSYTFLESVSLRALRCGPVPRHVAFIMDGNRRFARAAGIEKLEGHAAGFARLSETLQWCVQEFARAEPRLGQDRVPFTNEHNEPIFPRFEGILRYVPCHKAILKRKLSKIGSFCMPKDSFSGPESTSIVVVDHKYLLFTRKL